MGYLYLDHAFKLILSKTSLSAKTSLPAPYSYFVTGPFRYEEILNIADEPLKEKG